jgi:hypothetical protein
MKCRISRTGEYPIYYVLIPSISTQPDIYLYHPLVRLWLRFRHQQTGYTQANQ